MVVIWFFTLKFNDLNDLREIFIDVTAYFIVTDFSKTSAIFIRLPSKSVWPNYMTGRVREILIKLHTHHPVSLVNDPFN